MKTNIHNIYSRINKKNINLSYVDSSNNDLLINEISKIFTILPLQICIEYNIPSSYCLFSDPINETKNIEIAESYDIKPILSLNHIDTNRLSKKEDLYLFAESFHKYKSFTVFEEIKQYYQNMDVSLLDRPQIPSAAITKLSTKIKKYDIGMFCPNRGLSDSIINQIKHHNPQLQINTLDINSNKCLNDIYEEFASYNNIIIMDHILLVKISKDLGINTICNQNVIGAHHCTTISSIIDALSNGNNNSKTLSKNYDFDKMFENYIREI